LAGGAFAGVVYRWVAQEIPLKVAGVTEPTSAAPRTGGA
jgi:hypothetical protein